MHAKEGWFVVGVGRNGSEYSVLLIAALLAVIISTSARSKEVKGNGGPLT